MKAKLRNDADHIIKMSIADVLPDEAVRRALAEYEPGRGKTFIVAVGKAAWKMASAAVDVLKDHSGGIVITKYGHVMGDIPGIICYEAGHPIPDENGFRDTQKVIDLVEPLGEDDTVIFLLSGGGSALFESPLIPGDELADITGQLLASGADIVEINTIRKRLSDVKGGRFAMKCAPARVLSVVLSDIIGDPLDMIASGPAYPDSSTAVQALEIINKYDIGLSDEARALLNVETPKTLTNVETMITGSVRELCFAAEKHCRALGYETVFLTDRLSCEAKEAGRFLADILVSHAEDGRKMAFIAGGETVVHLQGEGRGGRNQELALAAAIGIDGYDNMALFSVGSDGTDGPTDAAGGYADGDTCYKIRENGMDPGELLSANDSYAALTASDGLITTGPTGTNVNDLTVGLIWPKEE